MLLDWERVARVSLECYLDEIIFIYLLKEVFEMGSGTTYTFYIGLFIKKNSLVSEL